MNFIDKKYELFVFKSLNSVKIRPGAVLFVQKHPTMLATFTQVILKGTSKTCPERTLEVPYLI